jgi:hypothetical protein
MWRKTIKFLTILLFVSAFMVTSAWADDADEIAELKQQVTDLMRRIEQLEAKQQEQAQEMETQITQAVEEKQAQQAKEMDAKITEAVEAKQVEGLPDSIKWIENVKLSGDFRYRYENIDAQGNDKGTRNRNRIRARLRIDTKVNDEFDAVFRVATAETDASLSDGLAKGSTSTNQTLTREFKQKNLWLDWAYGKYHPKYAPGLDVWFGKMGTPMYKVAKHQLLWDNDLAWEGGSANYKVPLNDEQALLLNGGGFWLRERDGVDTGVDTSLWTIQAALQQKLDNMSLTGGATYYHIGNSDVSGYTALERGTTSDFDDQFNLVELFGELGTTINGKMPISFYGVFANNTGTNSGHDDAWIIGTIVNKAKAPGSWELGYSYRDVQANSSTGLNDSDFIDGGTGGRGHEFKAKYQILKNVQGAITYIKAERDRGFGTDNDYDRLMTDIILKF